MGVTQICRSIGVHGYGFGPHVTSMVLKSVVTPTLLFACHLVPLTKGQITRLNQCLGRCAKMLRSLEIHTSSAATLFVLDVPPVEWTLALLAIGQQARIDLLPDNGLFSAKEASNSWISRPASTKSFGLSFFDRIDADKELMPLSPDLVSSMPAAKSIALWTRKINMPNL